MKKGRDVHLETIQIKQLTTIDQLSEMQQLEKSIWQMPPIPIHQTFTTVQNGGISLGAYDDEQMIGFLYSFPGFDGTNHYLCSHMLGFLAPYRKIGLGEKMKRKQAVLAKEAGFSQVTWTFDPLESVNAYVNIYKLGAIGHSYSEDHYGQLGDELNEGLPTDRMLIHWDLTNQTNNQRSLHARVRNPLVTINEKNDPVVHEDVHSMHIDPNSMYTVSIPDDFQTIKSSNIERAYQWRMQTRFIFQALFSRQFKAIGVERNKESNQIAYLFAQQMKEEL